VDELSIVLRHAKY